MLVPAGISELMIGGKWTGTDRVEWVRVESGRRGGRPVELGELIWGKLIFKFD